MKINFNALGVISSVDVTGDSLRQGSVGVVLETIFTDINNIENTATFNFTRSDGSKITNVSLTVDPSNDKKYKYTFNDEWYFAKAGTTTLTIFLRTAGGSIIAQGQYQFNIESTDYDDDPETITEEQFNSLEESIAVLGTIFEKVYKRQATFSIIVTPLININGRAMVTYTAEQETDENDNVYYHIIHDGEECDEDSAKDYMEYMTGSRYLPVYNYNFPSNSYFFMPDGTIWKPQFDAEAEETLKLYKIPNPLATLVQLENRVKRIIDMPTNPCTFTEDDLSELLHNPNARIRSGSILFERTQETDDEIAFLPTYRYSHDVGGHRETYTYIIYLTKATGVASKGTVSETYYKPSQADNLFETKTDALRYVRKYNIVQGTTTIQNLYSNIGYDKAFISINNVNGHIDLCYLTTPDDLNYYLHVSNDEGEAVYGAYTSLYDVINFANAPIDSFYSNNPVIQLSSSSGTLTNIQRLMLAQKNVVIEYNGVIYRPYHNNGVTIEFYREVQATSMGGGTYKRLSEDKITVTITSGNYYSSSNTLLETYDKTQIDNKLGGVYHYRGSKTVAQINALTGMAEGDVYNVTDSGTITEGSFDVIAGDNIAWTGSAWDKLGGSIDWDAYNERFMAAGFFTVEDYDNSTGEITINYSSDLFDMTYDSDSGILSIEAN